MNKASLRTYGRDIRANISNAQRLNDTIQLKQNVITLLNDSSIRVIQSGIDWIARTKACNDDLLCVGTYYPYGSEIIPPFVIDGYQMALPVMLNKTDMAFYDWQEGEPLVKNGSGIMVPEISNKSVVYPSILLMPLVLCDNHGNRIGQGAGHYDRYVVSCKVKPFLIGVCFDEQVYEHEILAEPHDMRLDLIITPKKVIDIP